MRRVGRIGGRLGLVGALLAALVVAPSGAVQGAVPGLTIQASLGRCFLHGLGVSDPMTATVRNADGKVKGTFAARLGSSGSWAVDCGAITLLPHDTVRLKDTVSGVTLRTLTMPVLTLSLDRVAGRITGRADGVASVELWVFTCPINDDDCSMDEDVTPAVGPDGRWQHSTADPVTGRSIADAVMTLGADRIEAFGRFPRLVVTLGSSRVTGSGNPGRTRIAVTSRRGRTVASATMRASALRAFGGRLRHDGAPRKVAAGDRIRWTIGGVLQAAFTVPSVRAAATPTHITGRCIPDRPVVVFAQSPDRSARVGYAGTAAADGRFEIAWTATAGWSAWAECQTAKEDVVRTPRVPVE